MTDTDFVDKIMHGVMTNLIPMQLERFQKQAIPLMDKAEILYFIKNNLHEYVTETELKQFIRKKIKKAQVLDGEKISMEDYDYEKLLNDIIQPIANFTHKFMRDMIDCRGSK